MQKTTQLEYQEALQKLHASGHDHIINILYHEADTTNKVYTRKGKLNKSGACRALKCKPKELEDALRECERILGPDWMD